MQARDHLELLVGELAHDPAFPALLLPLRPGCWIMQAGPELAVQLESADSPARLVISARLGTVSGPSTLAVFETLLSYNLLWRETGGLKMALDEARQELQLLLEMPLQVDAHYRLATVLGNFVELAGTWRGYLG